MLFQASSRFLTGLIVPLLEMGPALSDKEYNSR